MIPDSVHEAIRFYNADFRHPKLKPLAVSDLYALFPDELSVPHTGPKWPDPWPNADGPGVYLVFARNMELVYVGKSTSSLNVRVSSYFRYSRDGTRRCELKWEWRHTPCYIAIIAVDKDKFFEASALEEYLIDRMQPLENQRGIRESRDGNPVISAC